MGARHAAAEPGRGCVLPVLELCRGVAAARTQPEGPPGLWKGGSRASSECRAPQHGPSPGRAERRSCHRCGRLWAALVSPAGRARCAAARTVATTFSLASFEFGLGTAARIASSRCLRWSGVSLRYGPAVNLQRCSSSGHNLHVHLQRI